ncbi:MAG: biosynthetic arginine decarboxylase [Bacteriovoracaceae bacterium]
MDLNVETSQEKRLTTTHPETDSEKKEWTTEDADELYSISRWGDGYFGVNEKGNLTVLPLKTTNGPCIDIADVLEEMKQKNIQFPAVIRFHDILRSQVVSLNKTFLTQIEEAKFKGTYFGVYPIKVNQMREVVDEVMDAGAPYNYGLEAGSKAELLAVLAMNSNPHSLTICNGYKDEEFFRLALMGIKLGRKMIVVIEKFSELDELMAIAKEMDVEPVIGIRAKLSTKGSGKWANSGGDHAKFGLTIPEIISAVKYLKKIDRLQCLKLFHFHIGSQIPEIRTIKDAITEGARVYAKLRKMGAPIEYFDVGGGVGVDYDGSKSNYHSSMNYTLKDYAGDVIYILKQICDLEDVEHPHIVSETGRAVTAHHSCVVFPVFGTVEKGNTDFSTEKSIGEHILVENMRDLLTDLKSNNVQEIYNDALAKKDECTSAFKLGILDLDERAKIETIFWQICKELVHLTRNEEDLPEELEKLQSQMAEQYLCNISIFQSAPDTWGIGQVLPVVPIRRLNEEPTRHGTIADITCDSDGKIDCFLGGAKHKNTLPLHEIKEGEQYLVGLFLTGAYQDIMGDMHNLFGRLNEVHIFCDDDDPEDFYIEEFIQGNTAQEVLSTLQYAPQSMAQTVKKSIEKQIQRGKLRPREGVDLTDFYEKCLGSYTYLRK